VFIVPARVKTRLEQGSRVSCAVAKGKTTVQKMSGVFDVKVQVNQMMAYLVPIAEGKVLNEKLRKQYQKKFAKKAKSNNRF